MNCSSFVSTAFLIIVLTILKKIIKINYRKELNMKHKKMTTIEKNEFSNNLMETLWAIGTSVTASAVH